jgi:dTMP kinase
MNARGQLIVFEGIDGSGKSTQARLLAEVLQARGHRAVFSREPTQGKWGRMVRDSGITGRLSPQEELDLFHQDRAEHVTTLIAPALARGETVILDRYYFSTMAYQGARGFDPAILRGINEAFAPIPDLLFIFDLQVDAALARVGGRGPTTEFEKRDTLQRCREIFLSLSDEPFAQLIDATRTRGQLHAEVLATLDGHFPQLAAQAAQG